MGISVISLAGVVWWATRQPAPELPAGSDGLAALGASIVLYALATVLRGERWWWLLRQDGARPSRGDAYALTTVGYMGNNVLPARGGDAMRVYFQAPRAQTGMRNVVGTLVAERLLDALLLLTLFVLLAYGVLRGIDAPDGGSLALIAGVIAGLVIAAAGILRLTREREPVRRAIAFVGPMARATRDLRGRHGAGMAVLTLFIWLLEAATYWAAGAAVGLEMNPLEALYIVALAGVFLLIPSGPGYIGTLDAAILFGADAIGAPGGVAVSYLLMVRFVLLVPITICGLAILIARYGGRRAPARAGPA